MAMPANNAMDFGSLANSVGLGGMNVSQIGSMMGLNPIGQMAFGMTAPSSLTSLLSNPAKGNPAPTLAGAGTQPAATPMGTATPLPPNPGTQIDPATGRTFTIPGTDIPFDPAVQMGSWVGPFGTESAGGAGNA